MSIAFAFLIIGERRVFRVRRRDAVKQHRAMPYAI